MLEAILVSEFWDISAVWRNSLAFDALKMRINKQTLLVTCLCIQFALLNYSSCLWKPQTLSNLNLDGQNWNHSAGKKKKGISPESLRWLKGSVDKESSKSTPSSRRWLRPTTSNSAPVSLREGKLFRSGQSQSLRVKFHSLKLPHFKSACKTASWGFLIGRIENVHNSRIMEVVLKGLL